MQQLSDDELSELAECIEHACQEAIGDGVFIRPGGEPRGPDCNCPLGALAHTRYPWPSEASRATGLHEQTAASFMLGYDGAGDAFACDRGAYDLGRQFRERYS